MVCSELDETLPITDNNGKMTFKNRRSHFNAKKVVRKIIYLVIVNCLKAAAGDYLMIQAKHCLLTRSSSALSNIFHSSSFDLSACSLSRWRHCQQVTWIRVTADDSPSVTSFNDNGQPVTPTQTRRHSPLPVRYRTLLTSTISFYWCGGWSWPDASSGLQRALRQCPVALPLKDVQWSVAMWWCRPASPCRECRSFVTHRCTSMTAIVILGEQLTKSTNRWPATTYQDSSTPCTSLSNILWQQAITTVCRDRSHSEDMFRIDGCDGHPS